METFLADIAQLRAQHESAGFPILDGEAFINLISLLPQMFDTEVSLMEDWTVPDLPNLEKSSEAKIAAYKTLLMTTISVWR